MALFRSKDVLALKMISPPSPRLNESLSMALPLSISMVSPLIRIKPPPPSLSVELLTIVPVKAISFASSVISAPWPVPRVSPWMMASVAIIVSAVRVACPAFPAVKVSVAIRLLSSVRLVALMVKSPASPVPLKAEMLISPSSPSVMSGASI